MPAVTTTTGVGAVASVDPPGTSLTRGALLTGALVVGSALGVPATAQALPQDSGTRVGRYTDVAALVQSTSLRSVQLEGRFSPFVSLTTMARIRNLAPLSLREWGRVFGVSHTAVRAWLKDEPAERVKLGTVLATLEEASRVKPELGRWLSSSLPGLDLRPLDLLRDGRWRAFRGALVAKPAPGPTLSRAEIEARRRAETSWAVAETEIEPDEA